MSKRKISPTGKLAALAAAFWTAVIGGSIALHEYVIDPAPPPTGLQRLQSDFTAAIAARAEQVESEMRDAVLVEKLCGETAATLTAAFRNSGIAASFTAPYQPAQPGYRSGKCALYVNDQYLTTIDEADEFDQKYSREYLNEQLVEKLSPAALQRLGERLPGILPR